jgi:propane monooxygenase coupling protein
MAEIGDALGRDFDPYNFQVEMSTHYGKMVLLDDKVLLFADPDEARQYLTVGGKWFTPETAAATPAGT